MNQWVAQIRVHKKAQIFKDNIKWINESMSRNPNKSPQTSPNFQRLMLKFKDNLAMFLEEWNNNHE